MGRTSIRLSESSTSSLTHVETVMPEYGETKRRKGCYVNPPTGLILVLLAIALSIGVGLIVHFAHPCKSKTCPPCQQTTSTPDVGTTPSMDILWDTCKNLSAARNECLPGFDCTTTQQPLTTVAPKPSNIRLPDNFKPYHYNLHLRPFLYSKNTSEFHFNGSVEIYAKCTNQASLITLHSKQLDIHDIHVYEKETNNEVKVSKVAMDAPLNFLHLHIDTVLKAGSDYLISLTFSGPLKKDLKGIYYSDYTIDGETRYLLTSQLQTTDARKVFPCFDEPSLKATFNTTMDRWGHYETMSNTQIYESEDLGNGWFADHYTTTPVMSTYIMAFMVSDFNCTKTMTTNGKSVEICARPNAMEQTELATRVAGEMQEFFEEYHNITYPLPKTIHAAVQDFAAGAMENWGLIIYRETALLYDENTATADQKQRVVKVISHELAHQWFGNLVTANWWDDTWLNEGFASYLENLGVNAIFPEWDVINEMVVTKVQRSMVPDSLASSRPIYQEVKDYVGISQAFDSITYSKGASVIRMMKYFLGEDTFRWGLSNYLKDRAYKTATSSELFSFMTKQAEMDGKNIDVKAVMNTWIRQMGYPVVHVSYDKDKGSASFTQKHFLLNPSQAVERPSPYGYVWKIPLSVVTDRTADINNYTETWLNEKQGQIAGIEKDADWILANVKQRYFYRVNYDESNWAALINQLHSDHKKFHLTNRAQILDDSINLGRSNYIDQTLALNVSVYLRQEEAYVPWVSASTGFSYIDKMLSQTTFYGDFKQFMQDNIRNTYNATGWDQKASDTHLIKRLRTLISRLACKYGDQACLQEAKNRYDEWMKTETFNNTNNINPDLQPVVYCHGVEMGGKEEWEFAFSMYQKVNSGAEKSNLLQAMGCTKEEWLLRRYLEEALEEKVMRRQDFHVIIRHVSRSPLGRILAWHFMQDNWVLIRERFGDSTFALRKAVEYVTEGFSTERELDEVKNFMIKYPDQGNAASAFANAIETITANIAWRMDNDMKIKLWLHKFANS